jgi:predicted  nucleic acid-binding Zn-ribbon protein
MATLAFSASGQAFAEELPWKKQSSGASAPAMSAPSSHEHHYSSHATHADSSQPSGDRTKDDRKLNALAAKFYAISAKDPKAIDKLKKLAGSVHRFRTGLKHVGYDAADITKDARNLESRINAQRKKLEAQAGTPVPSTATGTH